MLIENSFCLPTSIIKYVDILYLDFTTNIKGILKVKKKIWLPLFWIHKCFCQILYSFLFIEAGWVDIQLSFIKYLPKLNDTNLRGRKPLDMQPGCNRLLSWVLL